MSAQNSNQSLPVGHIVIGDQIFSGKLIGAPLTEPVFGEVVFNTSMTGYQEILTDPSYAGQIVCFTTAHVGNYGTNSEDLEGAEVSAKAALIHHYPSRPSNFRSNENLEGFLKKFGKTALVGVDTRAVTLYLRDRGVTPGVVIHDSMKGSIEAIKRDQAKQDYASIDWIKKVTTREPYQYVPHQPGATGAKAGPQKFKVIVYDYGVKGRLLRELSDRGCELKVVPADFPAEKVLQEKPHGVFLSNGPGDPALATYAVKNVQALLGKVPLFGVCMGHQVLSMAVGAKTYKLKFGHRGGNQPVMRMSHKTVEISSHNHGYAVDEKTLPSGVELSHKNLNDECVEGIRIPTQKAFSVQYHPESSPGPHDSGYLFDEFIELMKSAN